MDRRPEALLVAGVGIDGDRYATGLGTYSTRPHIDRQVTLIEVEVLEAIARDRGLRSQTPMSQTPSNPSAAIRSSSDCGTSASVMRAPEAADNSRSHGHVLIS